MPQPVGKRAVNIAFVCPSVAYIANNSRTQRPSVLKFGRKVSHLRCDSHTSCKVKRSKVKVTRPINADTHRAPYLSPVLSPIRRNSVSEELRVRRFAASRSVVEHFASE